MKVAAFQFEIERVVQAMRVSNMTLEYMRDEQAQELIVEMVQSIAVNRQTFKDGEHEVSRGPEQVEFEFDVHSSWWDHAKAEVRVLRWATARGWLNPVNMDTYGETHSVEVERHYIQHVTVLDDGEQLPSHINSLEIQYLKRN